MLLHKGFDPLWVVAVVSSKRQRKWLLPQATLYYPVCCGIVATLLLKQRLASSTYIQGDPQKNDSASCKLVICSAMI